MDRKRIINELVKLLENEDNVINNVEINNDHEDLYKRGSIEAVLTGHRTVTINLLNKKQHVKFIEKLHEMK